MDQNISDSKSHIFFFFFFFANIISGVQLYSTRSMDIIRFFFILEFTAENLKPNKNQRKRSPIMQYIFAQKTSLILQISTLLRLKIIFSQNTAKKLSQFTNFPAAMFLINVRKNICAASFPDAQELLSWNTLKENVCIFLYISLKKVYFKDLARFYVVVWGVGGGWIISLRRLAVWVSENVSQFFILIEIFWNSAIFQYFNTFINSIKTLKLSRQFELRR